MINDELAGIKRSCQPSLFVSLGVRCQLAGVTYWLPAAGGHLDNKEGEWSRIDEDFINCLAKVGQGSGARVSYRLAAVQARLPGVKRGSTGCGSCLEQVQCQCKPGGAFYKLSWLSPYKYQLSNYKYIQTSTSSNRTLSNLIYSCIMYLDVSYSHKV